MLTVCTFKWKAPAGYRSVFEAPHVLALREMVAKHYPDPHRFVCITDDATGLEAIDTIPLWSDFSDVPSPHGHGNPSCYRRLKVFDQAMRNVLGERFVCLDLDTVIVADMRPIWNRPEPFVIWGETDPRSFYNGSMFLQTAGARAHVLSEFNPKTSPMQAKRAGKFGSDQGWLSYKLGPGEATWGRQDGVYSYRVHIAPNGNTLPKNARIVMFHGKHDPWSYAAQQVPWIRQHYPMVVAA